MKRLRHQSRAQSTVEFAFSLVVILLFIYATVMAFRWVGLDLTSRQVAYEETLVESADPLEQLDPFFYKTKKMNMVYNQW